MDITLSADINADYLKDVRDILANKEFLGLSRFRHHYATTRLMHSMNVSYISWILAKKFGCNAPSAARAGLLHDFFLYDPRKCKPDNEPLHIHHPKVAAQNSARAFQITEHEKKAILSHMFPLGPLPRSREAWIIVAADKICACVEVCHIAIALAKKNKVVVSPA